VSTAYIHAQCLSSACIRHIARAMRACGVTAASDVPAECAVALSMLLAASSHVPTEARRCAVLLLILVTVRIYQSAESIALSARRVCISSLTSRCIRSAADGGTAPTVDGAHERRESHTRERECIRMNVDACEHIAVPYSALGIYLVEADDALAMSRSPSLYVARVPCCRRPCRT
jgi:hypothetical protein